jgi:hypothetical protein
LKKLLDQGVYILLYAGDADYKWVSSHSDIGMDTNTLLVATGSGAKSLLMKLAPRASNRLGIQISPLLMTWYTDKWSKLVGSASLVSTKVDTKCLSTSP